MKLYNKTTEDIVFKSDRGMVFVPASAADGEDGPEVNTFADIQARLVLGECGHQVHKLVEEGKLRFDTTL